MTALANAFPPLVHCRLARLQKNNKVQRLAIGYDSEIGPQDAKCSSVFGLSMRFGTEHGG